MEKDLVIRQARLQDLEQVADLVVRLKRLNGEFDSLLKPSEGVRSEAEAYLQEASRSDKQIVLVADKGGKIVGMIKADMRTRLFYEPNMEGAISDFYVLPEYRRSGAGERLLRQAVTALRAKGADIVTAEFPSQNIIAVNFYKKLGFRGLVSVYASSV